MIKLNKPLNKARILISNDDGIDAEGIKILEEIACNISDDVWVIAPDCEKSGFAHAFTCTRPLKVAKLGDKKFSVDGTPTDCVLVALYNLMEEKPDLILSGINNGTNIGEDVTYSGTCGVAMEGAVNGIMAISMSQRISYEAFYNDAPKNWSAAKEHAEKLIRELTTMEWEDNTFVNINFPAVDASEVKGVRVAPQGKRTIEDEMENLEGLDDDYVRLSKKCSLNSKCKHSDIKTVREGYISVTPLSCDFTNHCMIKNLEKVF